MPLATQVQTIPLDCDLSHCVNPTNWLIRFKAPLHAFYEIYKIAPEDASDSQQVDGSGNSYGEGNQFVARNQVNVVGKDGMVGILLASSKAHLQMNDKVSILLRDEQGNSSEFSSNVKVTMTTDSSD